MKDSEKIEQDSHLRLLGQWLDENKKESLPFDKKLVLKALKRKEVFLNIKCFNVACGPAINKGPYCWARCWRTDTI